MNLLTDMKAYITLLFAAWFATSAIAADENIALGKPYTMEPLPNYSYCTDPGDIKQLTDGEYTKGYFWTQKSTVGWQSASFVLIKIDLGKTEPIRGASLNTAAGVAGVEWPILITVLTSDDNKTFNVAGDLSPTTPAPEGYGVRRYLNNQFKTYGRYVAFLIAPAGHYFFTDEIEVYRGDPSWVGHPKTGEVVTDLKAFFLAGKVQRGVERRLRADAQAVGFELTSIPRVDAKNFRAILPLNELHERIFAEQARRWRSQGIPPLVLWQTCPWDPLSHTQAPPSSVTNVAIRMAMMQNEFRAAAFNISNAGEKPVALRWKIEGLPDGITVHEVQWTDTAVGKPVAAALPLAGPVINVPAGLTRQVWLTFHPTNALPGIYKGRILVGELSVPITWHIYPLRFPDQPTLHLGGWDYTDVDARYEVTPQNRDAFIRKLREHFVDSPWATSAVFEFARFDEWLRRWQGARQYCVFANGDVSGKISAWVEHARSRGVKPEQLVLLLLDEPNKPEDDAKILAWAKAIRAANTGVKIWEDPTHTDPTKANQEMMTICDVLCPNRPMFLSSGQAFRDYYARLHARGIELAFYSCSGPVRSLDPYTYHRLQAWTCWQQDAKGSYFWAFGDSGGASSWNEYAGRVCYTPLFIDETTVTDGKHMEAIREGVEDYEYLVMLRDRIRTAPPGPVRERAQKLLATAAERVLNAPGASELRWEQPKDRSIADTVRVEILETLTALWQ